MHTAEPPPTTSLPSSRKFYDCKQSPVQMLLLAFFCSTLTQTVLMRTVAIREYKGHLQLKRSTAERHVKTTLLCPMYSLQVEAYRWNNSFIGIWQRYSCRAWCTKPWYLAHILRLYTLLLVMWALCSNYMKTGSHALITLRSCSTLGPGCNVIPFHILHVY